MGGVKYSYTVELRGPGFNPEWKSIEPAWREFWEGFRAMMTHIDILEEELEKKEEKDAKVS